MEDTKLVEASVVPAHAPTVLRPHVGESSEGAPKATRKRAAAKPAAPKPKAKAEKPAPKAKAKRKRK